MNIRLVYAEQDYDAAGYYYDLPANFILESRSIDSNTNIQARAFGHGGVQVGNLKIKPRTINIKGRFKADDTDTANEKINELLAFFLNAGEMKLYIIGETVRKYLRGVFFTNSSATDIIYDDYVDKTIQLDVEYPYWLNDTETTQSETSVSTGDTIAVNNTCSFVVYPVITIENNSGTTCSSFSFKNVSDSNTVCRINDINFDDGQSIVIDSVNGTVKKNGVSILQYLEGTFIKFLSGTNNLVYIGNTGMDITINYRCEVLH